MVACCRVGALSAALHAWDLLKEVTIISIASTIVWPQAPLLMEFSRQEYWNGESFPSPVDHVLSEVSTMIRLSWMALHGMALSFTELDKDVIHVINLVSFL